MVYSAPAEVTQTIPNEEQQFRATHLVERCIVVVGPSGSGKSELINAIGEEDNAAADLCPIGVTRDAIIESILVKIRRQNKDFCLRLFDTRGLTDSHQSFISLLPKWNEMIRRDLTKVHFVLFVIPVDRLSKSLLSELEEMSRALASWGMQRENVIVVLNKCDFFQEEKLDQYEAQLKRLNIPRVVKEAPLVRTCFLSPKAVIPEMEAATKLRFQQSRKELLELLLGIQNVKAFLPREASVATSVRQMTKREPRRQMFQNILMAFACGSFVPWAHGLAVASSFCVLELLLPRAWNPMRKDAK